MTRILVIDDSAMMRRMLKTQLERLGYDVEAWIPGSVFEIEEKLKQDRPDLVLSDYQMPGVNGLTVAKMVQRAQPPIPILILTALHDPEIEANLKKFGVLRVLYKPIEGSSLDAAIREALGAPPT